ncbi:MAG: hypothetical protein KGS72_17815 [Cyanobacteria bacterium REEB67]|nr:hypothetical protein [Cyanobacteria bacterium REEB67]
MHIFADFDNQTKLMHVGYSILGTLISLLVLVKLKPTIVPRMVAAVIFTVILLFCFSQPLTGDQERLKALYGTGWFFFGLLFGIGRGEFFIEWLTVKMFGSPTAALEKKNAASDGGDSSEK